MDEDVELNRLVREALEAQGAFALRPRRKHGALLSWLASGLLAASVAGGFLFRLPTPSSEACVVEAICLLSEAEGSDLGADATVTPAELLVAWQSAGEAEF